MSKLECHVVQDLLPMYADGLVSEETKKDIEEHLAECTECSALLEEMKKEENIVNDTDVKEIDFLKKVRNRTKKTILLTAAAALLLVAVPFFRYFVIGQQEESLIWKVSAEGRQLNVEAMEPGSALCITDIAISESEGVVTLDAKEVLPLFYRSGYRTAGYSASKDITKVVTKSGNVLYDQGMTVTMEANRLFKHRTKYVGNNSAVTNLLNAALVNTQTGQTRISYSYIELQTEKEPYGIVIHTDRDFTSFDPADGFSPMGRRDAACILLAGVENLSRVTFSCSNGSEYTYTAEDAEKITGAKIKSFAASPVEMQKLLNILSGTQEDRKF